MRRKCTVYRWCYTFYRGTLGYINTQSAAVRLCDMQTWPESGTYNLAPESSFTGFFCPYKLNWFKIYKLKKNGQFSRNWKNNSVDFINYTKKVIAAGSSPGNKLIIIAISSECNQSSVYFVLSYLLIFIQVILYR